MASTLISLMVTQCRTDAASASTTTSAHASKRAGESGRNQKSSPSQSGWVKWCSVTRGVRPRSTQPTTISP